MQDKLIVGMHAVEAALTHQAKSIEIMYVQAGKASKRQVELQQLARNKGIRIETQSKEALDKRFPSLRHQGVVALCKEARKTYSESDLLDVIEAITGPKLLLILDGITDPHNLGACLRSADAAGVHAVIAPKDNNVGLTPVVRKVASGAAETVPFIPVTNLARTIQQLQQLGIWFYGAAGEADGSLYDVDMTGDIALALGAEGSGLRRLTREVCDGLYKIPMQGTVESLNVSVAAGISLFEALRQRT